MKRTVPYIFMSVGIILMTARIKQRVEPCQLYSRSNGNARSVGKEIAELKEKLNSLG